MAETEVEKVRPGLWSVPVPLPGTPSHVLIYVLETDAGPYLVDSGWDSGEARAGLEAGLAELGTSVAEVRGVLMTHAHLDHYGLAGWIREESGAWISLHPADLPALAYFERDPAARLVETMTRSGAPSELVAEAAAAHVSQGFRPLPRPDRLIEDGMRVPIPGWDLKAIWTPGHTPGHLCFWDSRDRLLLSGDHVLPTISVSLPEPSDLDPDPLTAYLDSLDRLSDLPAEEVLAAHEYRFTGLDRRLAELRDHREARLARALAAVPATPVTAWTVAQAMRGRPLERLRGFPLQFALAEALTCLVALTTRGLLQAHRGSPPRWSRAGTRPARKK